LSTRQAQVHVRAVREISMLLRNGLSSKLVK
jgi:hypothetical protein